MIFSSSSSFCSPKRWFSCRFFLPSPLQRWFCCLPHHLLVKGAFIAIFSPLSLCYISCFFYVSLPQSVNVDAILPFSPLPIATVWYLCPIDTFAYVFTFPTASVTLVDFFRLLSFEVFYAVIFFQLSSYLLFRWISTWYTSMKRSEASAPTSPPPLSLSLPPTIPHHDYNQSELMHRYLLKWPNRLWCLSLAVS